MGNLMKIDYRQRMTLTTDSVRLKDIFLVFLKLGLFGFGGPAAHVAMMRQEVVEKRKWLSEQEFLDLWGAAQLIPGPNSTELAIHVGQKLRGWRGLLAAGVSFIVPAFLLVLSLAVFYHHFTNLNQIESFFFGIRPVILAIILDAVVKFRPSALKDINTHLIAVLSLILIYLGTHEVLLIFAVATGYACFVPSRVRSILMPLTDSSIFLYFVKVGSILFGSGYVLVSFLQSDLVDERMWLTQKQLLDAITVGQVTPGPVFTTATFIGYLLKGFKGALLATVGIFLPSFVLVAVSAPFLSRLQSSHIFRKFLDGVNAVSFALLIHVSITLGGKTFISGYSLAIGLLALLLLRRFKNLNSAWLILAAGLLTFFIPQP